VNFRDIDPSAKIYLRPIGLLESPQHHEGQSARLAGGMIWFCAVELIVRHGGLTSHNIILVKDWNAAIAEMNDITAGRAALLYNRLIAPRGALKMGDRMIRLDQPQVMGILNLTPDSFSDGGKFGDHTADAVSAAVVMAAAGAAIIDVGGESTRPDAAVIWEGDEIDRVCPAISQITQSGTAVSIDTRKSAVMTEALSAGAAMINDISALLYDERSLSVALNAGAPVVLMHAPSQGSDPHKGGRYDNVITDIFDWLEARVDACAAAGISRDSIVIDPGIGFGKTLADNLSVINNIAMLHAIGCPILFGASRKRLIGALSNEAEVDRRLGGSLFLAMKAVEQGVQILRVHDVAETVQAVRVWRGLRDTALTAAR
jgi:dihydropteroate synthase